MWRIEPDSHFSLVFPKNSDYDSIVRVGVKNLIHLTINHE